MRSVAIALAVVIPLLSASTGDAGTKKKRKKKLSTTQIVDRVVERNVFGFASGKAKLKMTLVDKDGDGNVRTMMVKSERADRDNSKMRVRFRSPKDVQGISLLIHEHDDRDDDLFIYMPAFKRTRRISSANKKNSFVGSDFTFADLEQREIKDGTYKRQEDITVDDVDCYQIEVTPNDQSLYSKLVLFVRKNDFHTQRIKYYDRRGRFLKVYRVFEVKTIDGQIVTTKAQMWTKRKKHTTFMTIESLTTRSKMRAADFAVESLGEL